MTTSLRMLAAVFAGFACFTQTGFSNAAEVKVLCGSGFRVVMEDLGPKFERGSGHKLVVSFATLEPAVKRLQSGEDADLVILPREGVDTLVKEGKVAAGNVTPLARVGLNLAVTKGAPKPDISSPDALKRTLLAAKSITYNDPTTGAASGIQFAKLLDRLGIAKEMKAKTVLATSAADMTSIVANGKADFVVHQRGSLLTVRGIDIVGPLPSNLYQPIVFTAIVMNSTKDAGTAKALVKFLRGPESAKVIKSKGMDPE